jgi:hypothetical protein
MEVQDKSPPGYFSDRIIPLDTRIPRTWLRGFHSSEHILRSRVANPPEIDRGNMDKPRDLPTTDRGSPGGRAASAGDEWSCTPAGASPDVYDDRVERVTSWRPVPGSVSTAPRLAHQTVPGGPSTPPPPHTAALASSIPRIFLAFSHPSQSRPTKHDSQPASRPLPWTTWTLDPCSSASSSPPGRPPAPSLPLRLGPARPHSGEGVVVIPPDGLTHCTVLNLERPFPCCYSRRLMHAAPPSVQAAESLTWHAGGL